MKKMLYWIVGILGPIMLASNTIPETCFAGFGDDPLGLIEKIDVIGTDKEPSSSLLDTITSTIRWVLGILATIAVIICLYAGFKMLTSGGDSKSYESGWTILKNASIGLVIIGLSWLIVSAVIWFVNLQGNVEGLDGTMT